MGSTSDTARLPEEAAAPDDDLDLLDLEQLVQSGDFCSGSWCGDERRSPVEWCRTGGDTDSEDERVAQQITGLLDAILNKEKRASAEKAKLDSRTFVRPKRRSARPGLQALLQEDAPGAAAPADKFLTYNKYNSPFRLHPLVLGDKGKPHLLTEKPAAVGRTDRLDGVDAEASDAESHSLSRPIDIDLSQPANTLQSTFTRGTSCGDRTSLSMFQSGASFLNMSPPSLVSSIVLDASLPSIADATLSHPPGAGSTAGRESLDAQSMLSSMTLSIMEDKDMSTSFLSQSTCHEQDSLIGSLPPSMPSSVDSSYYMPGATRPLTSLVDSTERLTMRPRADLFSVPGRRSDTFSKPHGQLDTSYTKTPTSYTQHDNSYSKVPASYGQRDNSFTKTPSNYAQNNDNSFTRSPVSNAQHENSYTKSPARYSPHDNTYAKTTSQYDTFAKTPTRIQNDSSEKRSPVYRDIMNETINMTYNKARFGGSPHHEKENISTLERNGTYVQKDSPERHSLAHTPQRYADAQIRKLSDTNEMQRTVLLGRNSLQLALDKQELTEIVQARHKLSLARNALPRDPTSPSHTAPPRVSDETPQRNATFKKRSPRVDPEATIIYVKDTSLADGDPVVSDPAANTTLQQEEEWGQRCAMVGSSDSADTATLSSSSPPSADSHNIHERNAHRQEMSLHQVASTPLGAVRRGGKDLLMMQQHISPIYNERTLPHPASVPQTINSATMVRRPNTKSPNKVSPNSVVAPAAVAAPRRSGLPTSKLRQYSSHKELSRIPGGAGPASGLMARGALGRGGIQRRTVYASNPALSPTAPAAPASLPPPVPLQRRDSYTISTEAQSGEMRPPVPALVRQGTETLRRPQSQLTLQRDVVSGRTAAVASLTQLRVRPSAHTHKPVPATAPAPSVPAEPASRASVLPRPSRLPAPRRTLRPPSVYSVAPTADVDHY